jgi:CBS domain-containing protein
MCIAYRPWRLLSRTSEVNHVDEERRDASEAMMKVKDLMSAEPKICAPDTTAAAAANLMWEGDCGMLPVVDGGQLVGVVTDRDMYIALATRNELAGYLRIDAVACTPVVTCAPEDNISDALAAMKRARVRRLPVVGFGNSVLGVLSINDIVRAAGSDKAVRAEDVVQTLQAICAHHRPAAHVVAA